MHSSPVWEWLRHSVPNAASAHAPLNWVLGGVLDDRVSFEDVNGATLEFNVLGRTRRETRFSVVVSNSRFRGSVETDDYVQGPPSLLFGEMGRSWQGWKDELVWYDLDGQLEIKATFASTGRIRMEVTLRDNVVDSRLCVSLLFYAGQLEDMAKKMNCLFGGAT